MKKLLYLLLLITTSFILVSCDTELKTHTIKIYDGDNLINNYFVDNGKPFEKTELAGLINSESFDYWSTTKDGVKYTFTLPVTSDLELYAIYKDNLPTPPIDITKFRITLILDSKNIALDVEKNSILTLQLVNDKYTGDKEINYWSTSTNGSKVIFPITVSTDLTLYAIFKSTPMPDPDPSPNPYPPTDLGDYYKSISNVDNSNLQVALRKLISSYKHYSYDAMKTILAVSDEAIDKKGYVWRIYDSSYAPAAWGGDTNWNREHVWPQSKLADSSAKSDAHHLRASEKDINSRRGNFPFADGMGKIGYKVTKESFYPGDEHKGDVARMLFYMATRYSKLNITSMGKISMLLKWHLEDPVDDFERKRNDVIYSYQKNRNPFIDHPEFAQMIWGSNSTNTSILDELTSNKMIISTEILYYEEKRNYFI